MQNRLTRSRQTSTEYWRETQVSTRAQWETFGDECMPDPQKGIIGMEVAHKVLQKNQAVGILIGGLLTRIWHTEEIDHKDFSDHKDVDVLILDTDKWLPKNKWQHGIDWFAETSDGVIRSPGKPPSNLNLVLQPVTFDYRVTSTHKEVGLSPGLYIPDRYFAVDILKIQAMANMRERGESTDNFDSQYELPESLFPDAAYDGSLPVSLATLATDVWEETHPRQIETDEIIAKVSELYDDPWSLPDWLYEAADRYVDINWAASICINGIMGEKSIYEPCVFTAEPVYDDPNYESTYVEELFNR